MSWTSDPGRLDEAHVPTSERAFQEQWRIALALLDQVRAENLPHQAVLADAGYGEIGQRPYHAVRRGSREANRGPYGPCGCTVLQDQTLHAGVLASFAQRHDQPGWPGGVGEGAFSIELPEVRCRLLPQAVFGRSQRGLHLGIHPPRMQAKHKHAASRHLGRKRPGQEVHPRLRH